MKVGISGFGIGKSARPSTLCTLAEHAERLNFATLWAPEHVVLFDQHESRYPYSEDGRFLAGSTINLLDPFVGLSYAAARTNRIRLATGICLVPEHNPLVLAKVVASLDRLSGGRFALGVGIGWSSEEFAALGIPFERRAQRTSEYIEVMRKLWGQDKSAHRGEFVNFEDARSFPKPAQGANVPIIFGGESLPALRRVASQGTGWFGVNLDPDQAAATIAKLTSLLEEKGRSRREVDIIISPYHHQITPADLRAYHELGVTEIVPFMRLPPDDQQIPGYLEQIAHEWVEPAAKLQ
jgi:probable F420-dependent oxidoreductase